MSELATWGLLLMSKFYNIDRSKKQNEDLELPYPDLPKFDIYTKWLKEKDIVYSQMIII